MHANILCLHRALPPLHSSATYPPAVSPQQTQLSKSQQTQLQPQQAPALDVAETAQSASSVLPESPEDALTALHMDTVQLGWDSSDLLPMPAVSPSVQTAPAFRPETPEVGCAQEQAQSYATMIREAMVDMKKVGPSEGRLSGFTEDSWMQQCEGLLGQQGDFKAAQPRQHAAGYQEYWNLKGPFRQQSKYSNRRQS